MANDELNQLIKVAREAAFFIRSIDGYENSKIANELSSLAEKVEAQTVAHDHLESAAKCNCYRNDTFVWERCPIHGGGV